jgi:hypothetical protein
MTTDEKLEKWRELGETYVSQFRGEPEHVETVDIVDELLTWSDTADITNQGIIMAWEGVGRRVLPLIEDVDGLDQQILTLKVMLGDSDVAVPNLTITIGLENVQISEGLDPLDADSYRISIYDSEGEPVVENETPHIVTTDTE